MFNNPYEDTAGRTDLGRAFLAHQASFRHDVALSLPGVCSGVLDAIESRSEGAVEVARCRGEMAALLADPKSAGDAFRARFMAGYEAARAAACPLWTAIVRERRKLHGVSSDYTLWHFDPSALHALEEEALSDSAIGYFVKKMLDRLAQADGVDQTAWRQAFEAYSEAVAYRLLRNNGGEHIKVERMPEADGSTPDFKCTLASDPPGTFYVEVKTLDIVNADQRHPEMLDDGMLVQDDIDRQVAAGKRIAMATGEVAPYRKFGDDPDYDWRAGKMSIERLIDKCRQNFKAKQFALGPTFGLASLLRMPIGDGGLRPLAPFAYDGLNGGACVSGELWNVCFGMPGDPIHRTPEFEGKGSLDGRLEREGILVGSGRIDSPGVLFLRHEDGECRLDGLIDPYWPNEWAWSSNHTEDVVWTLCRAYNDAKNSNAYLLSNPVPP